MSLITILNTVLALSTLAAGLQGAGYWLKSSRVSIVPWTEQEPIDPYMAQMAWTVSVLKTSAEAARLNVIAARWTALATILGTMTTLVALI